MNKKSLLILGIGAVGVSIYLYEKAKKKANEIKESTGDAVSNKVGEVTEAILTKVMDGSSASNTTSVVNQISPPSEVVTPPSNTSSVVTPPSNNSVLVTEPNPIEEIFQQVTPPPLPTRTTRPVRGGNVRQQDFEQSPRNIYSGNVRNTWESPVSTLISDSELSPIRGGLNNSRNLQIGAFENNTGNTDSYSGFGSTPRRSVDGWQNMIN